ncbi:MAG: phosphoribosylglycinamide formyltransferase [Clostridia bacterium]|nr:phosphoribosylglycinamide formyltransferase [Clostridia bacterium]
MNDPVRLAVLVSGGGTNLQAIIDSQKSGIIKNAQIQLVISSNPNAYALMRAKENGIAQEVISKKEFKTTEKTEEQIMKTLEQYGIELIVLAGYMQVLSKNFTKRYEGRIINVHPSLIPAFCGDGFYGLRVHEAALKKGVKVTGATVHFVNEITDGGEIIMQKAVRVLKNDTPETLQKRVMQLAEWKILPRAVEKISRKIIKEREKK